MTDHEINLALALFMGWREFPAAVHLPIPQGHFTVTRDPGCQPTIWRSLAPKSTHEPWCPLSTPAQAVEVMAEAARRGWEIEARIGPHRSWVHVSSKVVDQSDNEPYSGIDPWCRAVCTAIVEAHEKASPPGDQR
jgi:hypothetical protein